MTILDAYQNLNEFFNENQVLNLRRDFRKVVLVTDRENDDKASVLCALTEMEKSGIVKSTTIENEVYWVLFKPLEAFSQDVEVNYLLAAGIASVINKVCEALKNDSDKCDPKNITEKDLKNLIFIASKVSEENLKN
jgi:hypothetical protein